MKELEDSINSLAEGKGDSRSVFKRIFRVNQELGKRSRMEKRSQRELIEVQTEVNIVTIEIKLGRTAEALSAFHDAQKRLESLGAS